MKKILYLLTVFLILLTLAGCMNNDNETLSSVASKNNVSNNETASKPEKLTGALGEFIIDIKGCRLAKDIESKDIVIINYAFCEGI